MALCISCVPLLPLYRFPFMPASPQPLQLTGAAGVIDCLLELPDSAQFSATPNPRGWALILHPHPLHGGSRDNKVVTTLSKACLQHGLATVRPNFRGVGLSAGAFDHARGETADMRALVDQLHQRFTAWADLPWVVGGFSFGTAVAVRLYQALPVAQRPHLMMLTGTAAARFAGMENPVNLPDNTLVVHGEMDEVVPLAEAMDFARQQQLPLTVIPDATHFFHGKLIALRRVVQHHLNAALPLPEGAAARL